MRHLRGSWEALLAAKSRRSQGAHETRVAALLLRESGLCLRDEEIDFSSGEWCAVRRRARLERLGMKKRGDVQTTPLASEEFKHTSLRLRVAERIAGRTQTTAAQVVERNPDFDLIVEYVVESIRRMRETA